MSNEEPGPNEWEHQNKLEMIKDPLPIIKVIIILGCLPVIAFVAVWICLSFF